MAMMSHYDSLAQSLKSAGFHTSLRQISKRRGVELVCNTAKDQDGRLHGNSFWVWYSERADAWFIVTWQGLPYKTPNNLNLVDVCAECLRVRQTPIFRIPAEIVDKYDLTVVAINEFDSLE